MNRGLQNNIDSKLNKPGTGLSNYEDNFDSALNATLNPRHHTQYKKSNLVSPVDKSLRRDQMKRQKNKETMLNSKPRNTRYVNNISDYEDSVTGI